MGLLAQMFSLVAMAFVVGVIVGDYHAEKK